jgi:hypothetical protein
MAKILIGFIAHNEMKRMSHSSNSPDFVSLDFFLFGYVKGKLTEYRVDNVSELRVRIEKILEEIECDTLNTIFNE